MRAAGTFITILVAGVLIVLIYQWSGDSVIVLTLCLLTLGALLALWDRKPWQPLPDEQLEPDGADDGPPVAQRRADMATSSRRDRNGTGAQAANPASVEPRTATSPATSQVSADGPTAQNAASGHDTVIVGPNGHGSPNGSAPRPTGAGVITEDTPIWRSRFGVTVDDDGITGLALGQRKPQQWPWDVVAWAGVGWSQAITEGDVVEQRVGLHLGLGAPPEDEWGAPIEPEADGERVQLMFGPYQEPGRVLGSIRRGITAARIRRSRFHHLTHGERTRIFASALSPVPMTLAKDVRSPELLYQDARRALLTDRALRRVSRDAEADQILVLVEQLLEAHDALALTPDELRPLEAVIQRNELPQVYHHLGLALEDRGFRLAFINHGGDDHLMGLLATDDAQDWDGQTVGSGLAVVTLDPPVYQD